MTAQKSNKQILQLENDRLLSAKGGGCKGFELVAIVHFEGRLTFADYLLDAIDLIGCGCQGNSRKQSQGVRGTLEADDENTAKVALI